MTEEARTMINAYEQWKALAHKGDAPDPRRFENAWKAKYGKVNKTDPDYIAFCGFVGAVDAYRAEKNTRDAYVREYQKTADGMKFIATMRNAEAYQMNNDKQGGLMLRQIKFLALIGSEGIMSAYNIGFRRGRMNQRKEK